MQFRIVCVQPFSPLRIHQMNRRTNKSRSTQHNPINAASRQRKQKTRRTSKAKRQPQRCATPHAKANSSKSSRHRNTSPPAQRENPASKPRQLERNRLYLGDCRELLPLVPDCSVDLVLPDGPYFLDGLGNNWDADRIRRPHKGTVHHLPSGMKFDPEQGRTIYRFYLPVCRELFRVLKPGGYCLAFAHPVSIIASAVLWKMLASIFGTCGTGCTPRTNPRPKG